MRRHTLKCGRTSRLSAGIKENGRDATFDLNSRFKCSLATGALLGTELQTQGTELAHVVYSTGTQCIFTT